LASTKSTVTRELAAAISKSCNRSNRHISCMESEVVKLYILVFLVMIPRSLTCVYTHFGRNGSLHLPEDGSCNIC
jgi:hypothetical protein